MKEEEAAKFIAKKAYEIGYALCRVAARIPSPLSSRLEDSAFRLIEAATVLHVAEIWNSLDLLKNYVRIGADTSIIHKSNADLLLSEILKFDSALVEMESINLSTKANLSGIFSSGPLPSEKKKNEGDKETVLSSAVGESDRQSAKDRQSAILNFVSKHGNCRMKDLLENFPATSERTLRYDLQGLVEQGAIQRVGEGGPGTYYQAKPIPQAFPQEGSNTPLPGASNL